MAIGKLVGEALAEGLVFKLLLGAWGIAKDMFKDEVKTATIEKIKKAIDSKGWEDEHYFALDLAEASITPEQRQIINEGVMYAEKYDKTHNTKSARHFRIIVTFGDIAEGVDVSNRPGKKILEQLAVSCKTKLEVFAAIQVMGAMHDQNFSMENMIHLAKESWFPFLKASMLDAHEAADQTLLQLENVVEERNTKFSGRNFLKKLFLN